MIMSRLEEGVWKDTLWIKNLLAPQEGQSPKPGQYTITVRTRYQRYISIGVPDGRGGTAVSHGDTH